MGKSLGDLFDDTKTAEDMIALLQDTAARAVAQDIEAHKQIWQEMKPDEREASLTRAVGWATRRAGHRIKCPACGCPALIRGSSYGVVATEVREDVIVQRQMMLPSSFECVACHLNISGLSKLSACGLGDAFTATSRVSAADFFDLHTEEELEEAQAGSLEDDYNE
jgi:hypothetical protein